MSQSLVIAGSGFLGNNLLRELIRQGKSVRTTVRDVSNSQPFDGLDCELIEADMLDKASLVRAMRGTDVVYNCAAVYKMWAKDPNKEIVEPNIQGASNVVQAAIEAKVKRLVFVSSAMVQSAQRAPINEESGYDPRPAETYAESKIEAEEAAWALAKSAGLDMISVLPVGMIGGHSYGHIPPAMAVYHKIMGNKLPFDPQFYFNVVDVKDVTRALIYAAENASKGERYILGPDRAVRSTEVFQLAHRLFPDVKVQPPKPKAFLTLVSSVMEMISKVTGKPPVLQRSTVKQFSNPNYVFDSGKAERDLGWKPRASMTVIEELLKSIHSDQSR